MIVTGKKERFLPPVEMTRKHNDEIDGIPVSYLVSFRTNVRNLSCLLDRLGLLQLFDPFVTQSQDPPEYFIVVRADPRRWSGGAGFRERWDARQAVMRDFAPRLRFGLDDVTTGAQVNVVKKILARRRNAGGDTRLLEHTKKLLGRVLARPLRKFSIKLVAMLLTALPRRKLCVRRPRGFTDQAGHALPFLVAAAGDDDPVIFPVTRITVIRRIWLAQDFAIPHGVPFVSVNGVVEDRRSHHRALRFQHAGLDELPFAGASLIFERGEHAQGHGHRAEIGRASCRERV